MGARNVSAAFAMWARLPHGAFRLLVGMALQSLDQPSKEGRPARIYYGGETAMVESFGRSPRSMYDALATLKREGAVEVIDSGRQGHRAVYKLALDPLAVGAQPAETRRRKPAETRTEACEDSQVKGAESRRPRNHEGMDEESRQGDKAPAAVVSPAPVDNSGAEPMDRGTANQILIQKYGRSVHDLLEQHAATHPDCDNPAGHLLATTRSLTVIKGGKTA